MSEWWMVLEKEGTIRVVPSMCDACNRGDNAQGHFACGGWSEEDAIKKGYTVVKRTYCERSQLEEDEEIEKPVRNTYFDLIELPSGRHIPVPIAEQLVGQEKLAKIPVSRKKRDENFFSCPVCGEKSFYVINDGCVEDDRDSQEIEEERQLKEKAFTIIIRNGQFWKLRYIRAELY